MNSLEEKYQSLLKESHDNSYIVGLFLGGSRGKDFDFVTKDSDLDVYVVVSDDAPPELLKKLRSYESDGFEIRVYTKSEFIKYAAWGSDREWDKYNFAHNKAIIDKTGDIQKVMDEKIGIPADMRTRLITESLDSYINEVYRSAKYWRDGNELSAYLDATESLPFLMTALYALAGRLKPYNKYFQWELEKYPLKFLPWSAKEFIVDYVQILRTGDIKTQEKVYKGVKRLFSEQGFSKTFEDWKNYYFVGD